MSNADSFKQCTQEPGHLLKPLRPARVEQSNTYVRRPVVQNKARNDNAHVTNNENMVIVKSVNHSYCCVNEDRTNGALATSRMTTHVSFVNEVESNTFIHFNRNSFFMRLDNIDQ